MTDFNSNKKKFWQGWSFVFKNALNGLRYAFTTQRNFIVHLILSFFVILLAVWLAIPFSQFIILIITIVFGLTAEMVNTAFEKTVDLVTEEYNEKAKIAKDVSAGMMLITSIGMAIIGLLILFPPLWQKIIR